MHGVVVACAVRSPIDRAWCTNFMSEPQNTAQTGDAPERADERAPTVRDKSGRFVKGAPSPNPGGRPKVADDLVELARGATAETFEFLLSVMRNPKASRRDRVRCAEVVLAYGHGKPTQALTVSGKNGEPLSAPQFAFTITFPDGGPGNPVLLKDERTVEGALEAPGAASSASRAALPGSTGDDDVEISAPGSVGDDEMLPEPARAPEPRTPDPAPIAALPAPAPSSATWATLSDGVPVPVEGTLETLAERRQRERAEHEQFLAEHRSRHERFNNAEAAAQRLAGIRRDWNQRCEDARQERRPAPPMPTELEGSE